MQRTAAMVLAVMLAAAVPALAANSADEVKALREQVRSLQDANVVMKEDLAKTQLQLAEMAASNRAQADAAQRELADLAKQVAEMRQALANEQAAHEAALRKAQADAAAARRRAKDRQMWLYVVGGALLVYAATK
jgi:hypothetical protein